MYQSARINIGEITLGGNSPVRIQSMTNTDTQDTASTVEQTIRIIEAGADMVRYTVRSLKEAENLKNIKHELRQRGYREPLIADVHFNPGIAMVAAGIVEKIRINPGNFTDIAITENFLPLLDICRKNKTAMRIGVNHGSLSLRIMDKYGDTPEGMVESALEYLRICKSEDFPDVVVSLKSSNARVMIQSNRLLIRKMQEESMEFPVHLGITEAGEGEDGRIRSAIGIGTLLNEGIGDTIRISLTEEPEKEIPVARNLVFIIDKFANREIEDPAWDIYHFSRRETNEVFIIGGNNVPVVIQPLYRVDQQAVLWDRWMSPDYIYSGNQEGNGSGNAGIYLNPNHQDYATINTGRSIIYPIYSSDGYLKSELYSGALSFIEASPTDIDLSFINKLSGHKGVVLILSTKQEDRQAALRKAFNMLIKSEFKIPAIIKAHYTDNNKEIYMLRAASELGVFFTDGMANGIWLENQEFHPAVSLKLAFDILQASRARMYKTEYIACPSCGRTLFNIQEVLSRVQSATSHLRHLKIAVMGCIVNGPGEMADADYGYIGSGPGKVSLYKQSKLVKKNIPEEEAVGELLELIRENGDWVET